MDLIRRIGYLSLFVSALCAEVDEDSLVQISKISKCNQPEVNKKIENKVAPPLKKCRILY
jgi:hypothetical protein